MQGRDNWQKKIGIQVLGGIADNDFGANSFYAAPNDKESTEHVSTAVLSVKLPIALRPQLGAEALCTLQVRV